MRCQVNPLAVSFVLASLALACDANSANQNAPANEEALTETSQEKKVADKKEAPKSEAKKMVSSASSDDPALARIDAWTKEKEKSGDIDKSQPRWKGSLPFPPQLEFDKKKNYFWNMRTNKGDIKIRLMPDIAPMHVSSTIFLIRSGFYDNVVFHRVIPNFMAQGGDPTGTGRGGPGYKYPVSTAPKRFMIAPGCSVWPTPAPVPTAVSSS